MRVDNSGGGYKGLNIEEVKKWGRFKIFNENNFKCVII